MVEDKSTVEKLKRKLQSKNEGRADGRKATVEDKATVEEKRRRKLRWKTGEDARVEMRREAFKKRKFLESF